MLSKEQIRDAQAEEAVQELDVESLGGTLRFRKLKANEVRICVKTNNSDARLIARSVLDENDEPLFTIAEADALNADVFGEIGKVIGALNGWDVVEKDLEKN